MNYVFILKINNKLFKILITKNLKIIDKLKNRITAKNIFIFLNKKIIKFNT